MTATAVSPQLSPAWGASLSYLWEVPGKPVIVNVALEVVDRLDREVVESFRSLEARGAEIGGLLLGAVQGSSPFEVFIQSYEVVPLEYERGPLYKLSLRDVKRFEGVLEQRVGAGMQIVGFFRSHTRKGLGLDTEDVTIFNKFFPKQYQVALLAKPFATKLTAGAIFIREGRSLRSESSYKEFHFRTSTVERRGPALANLQGGEKASPAPASKPRAGHPFAMGRAAVFPSEPRGGVIVTPLPVPGSEAVGFAATEIAAETIAAAAEAATALTAPSALQPTASRDRRTTPRKRTAENTGWALKLEMVVNGEEGANSSEALDKLPTRPTAADSVTAEANAPAELEPDAWTGWAPTLIPIEQDRALPGGDAPQRRRAFGLIWIAVSAALIGIIRAVKPMCIAASATLPAVVRTTRAICSVASAKLLAAVRAARPICIGGSAKLATAATAVRPMWTAASDKLSRALAGAWPSWIDASPRLAVAVKSIRPMWVAGGAATALVVLTSLLFLAPHRTKRTDAHSSRNTSTLSFRVERSEGELFLTWNKDADVIQHATHAVLAIGDGERQQNVNLDQAQLRHGRIVYLSYNPEINFQLRVTGRKPSQTQSEFVRVLRVSPWLTPAPQRASPTKPVPMRTTAAGALAHMSPKPSGRPGASLAKAANEAGPQADDLAEGSGSASAVDLPDAPVLAFGPQAQAVLFAGNTQLSAFQLPVTAPPDIPKPRVGGQASEAQILTQTPPEYPLAARQGRVHGSVVVRAVIGVDGHVKLAKALSGPPVLQNPAVAAVRRWVYKPATLNGVAVESETRIQLHFTLY